MNEGVGRLRSQVARFTHGRPATAVRYPAAFRVEVLALAGRRRASRGYGHVTVRRFVVDRPGAPYNSRTAYPVDSERHHGQCAPGFPEDVGRIPSAVRAPLPCGVPVAGRVSLPPDAHLPV